MVLFVLANITDATTTLVNINNGAREGNPVVASLIGSLGLETGLVVKVLLATAAGSLLYWRKRITLLTILTVGLVIVSLSNAFWRFF